MNPRLPSVVRWAGALLAVSLAAPSLPAQGHLYRVTDLGIAGGYPLSRAVDVNEHGQVLVSGNWPPQTYVYEPALGQLVPLGAPPGELRFEGTQINDRGQVAGQGIGTEGLWLFTPGQGFADLGRLLPSQPAAGIACGLNGRGEVVGSARGLAAGTEPFAWTPAGGMQAVAPGLTGYLCALNDAGEAVGRIGNQWVYWVRSSGATGLAVPLSFAPETIDADGTVVGYTGGQILLRDRFGAITSLPGVPVQHTGAAVRGRNRQGVMVGDWQYYYVSGSSTIFRTGAFLHVPGYGTVDLTPAANGLVDPAWEVVGLAAINELGQIVGTGRLRGGLETHAIRLDPVAPAAAVSTAGQGCGAGGGGAPVLTASLPRIARGFDAALGGGAPGRLGALVVGLPAPVPLPLAGCSVHVDPLGPMVTIGLFTDAQGSARATVALPPHPFLLGMSLMAQAVVLPPPPALEFTNGLLLRIGF